MIGADGDAVAIAAHDHERLLNGVGATRHHIVEHALDRRAFPLHALPDRAQLGRCFFAQLAVVRKVLVQFRDQCAQVGDLMRVRGEAREGVGAQERLANGLRRAHAAEDDPRFVDVENGVAVEQRRDIRQTRQRQQPLGQNESHHLREVRLRRFAFGQRTQRMPPGDTGLAERALRLHRDQREDAVELELLERDGVHAKLLDVRGWRAIPLAPA